jgi:hypothetical protein
MFYDIIVSIDNTAKLDIKSLALHQKCIPQGVDTATDECIRQLADHGAGGLLIDVEIYDSETGKAEFIGDEFAYEDWLYQQQINNS